MKHKEKRVLSSNVPLWFHRQLAVRAAEKDLNMSEYVYKLLRLALRREDWLEREVARRSSPQLEFPPILVETLDE